MNAPGEMPGEARGEARGEAPGWALADPPPSAWLAAAARAAGEQAELGRAAAEIERWLRRADKTAIDVERILDFVARVRLGTALAGGDLAGILLSGSAAGQTNGPPEPTPADDARPPD